jgi:predicted phosphodiesterase
MKLLVYSDLHLDLCPLKLQLDPDFLKTIDVVVLAGDITEGTRGLPWARETFPDKAIVYVDGNHEFYGQNWDKHVDAMRQLAREREIHYLENDAVMIGGVRFLGCALWTDFALHGADSKLEAMSAARQRMNDYKRIKISPQPEMYWQRKHRLFPAMAARRHQESRQWLEELLGQGDPQNTVVVTHHAPHLRSIPEDFAGHPLSPCYASDLDALMGRASTWIHGHIHDSVDYRVRGTRIVSNPRGYKLRGGDMQNLEFRVDFSMDVAPSMVLGAYRNAGSFSQAEGAA